ncbi:hypothetical protein GMO_00580 [Gluconobacter morbifer G707]|uniref:Uncharacterized protein n=1 Tax=Gluconobacter morbifer G707 TaxID=1088869 RepID=G6XEZ3_9PROT|nr:hypothetical protein GMO_00580 [Gluconobacter morbifer G707]
MALSGVMITDLVNLHPDRWLVRFWPDTRRIFLQTGCHMSILPANGADGDAWRGSNSVSSTIFLSVLRVAEGCDLPALQNTRYVRKLLDSSSVSRK